MSSDEISSSVIKCSVSVSLKAAIPKLNECPGRIKSRDAAEVAFAKQPSNIRIYTQSSSCHAS